MPMPSDTITITAVVPIMTPSTVRVVRNARWRSDARLEATRSEKRTGQSSLISGSASIEASRSASA